MFLCHTNVKFYFILFKFKFYSVKVSKSQKKIITLEMISSTFLVVVRAAVTISERKIENHKALNTIKGKTSTFKVPCNQNLQ